MKAIAMLTVINTRPDYAYATHMPSLVRVNLDSILDDSMRLCKNLGKNRHTLL